MTPELTSQKYDANAKCPKCGHKVIATIYRDKGEHVDGPYDGWYERETMQRICTNCHYKWHEAPLDAKGATDAKV